MPLTPLPDERLCQIRSGLCMLEKTTGLCLGTDALLLSAFCRGAKDGRAVELGCGSGVVSLLLASRGAFRHITAVDCVPALYDLTRRNVEKNGFSDIVRPLLEDVRNLSPTVLGFTADAVFANPPYFDPTKGRPSPHAERQSARHETAGNVFDFTAAASRCLPHGGRFTCVWRPDRTAALFAALAAADLTPKRMAFAAAHPNAAPCLLLIEAIKGGGEGLILLPTLFLRESDQQDAPLTIDANIVYENGVWPSYDKKGGDPHAG